MVRYALLIKITFLLAFTYANAQLSEVEPLQLELQNAKSKEEKAKLLTKIGMSYLNTQVYYDSAFYYNEKAYEIATKQKLKKIEANTLFNFGLIHNGINNYELAIEYYEKAIVVIEELGISGPLSSTYNNIGGSYFELKQYDKALLNYQKALTLAEETGNVPSIGIDLMNIGEVRYKMGQLEQSKKDLELAMEILNNEGYNPATAHLFYARTLVAMGDSTAAIEEAQIALDISEDEGDLRYISEEAELLAKLYSEQGNFEKAYQYHAKHMMYKDSLNLAKKLNENEKLKLNIELAKSKKELALLSQKSKYQNIIYILVTAGLLLLVVIIFRQRKVVLLTKGIHDIQKRLVEQELDAREWKLQHPNSTGFDAAKSQDQEN